MTQDLLIFPQFAWMRWVRRIEVIMYSGFYPKLHIQQRKWIESSSFHKFRKYVCLQLLTSRLLIARTILIAKNIMWKTSWCVNILVSSRYNGIFRNSFELNDVSMRYKYFITATIPKQWTKETRSGNFSLSNSHWKLERIQYNKTKYCVGRAITICLTNLTSLFTNWICN